MRKTPTPPKMKAPARCLGRTAARTPQTAKMVPPAPVEGAAALLAVSKAASLRIVDGVRTPAAEPRATRASYQCDIMLIGGRLAVTTLRRRHPR
jgi:hypothetical protein